MRFRGAPGTVGGATGVAVAGADAGPVPTAFVAVGNVTSYVDTATTKGVRYYYKVTAVNAVGEGPPSTESSATAK